MKARRILLLELLNEAEFRHFRASTFPFLLGWLRECGREVQWWALPVPPEHMHEGGRFIVDLDQAGRRRLAGELERFRPELIVTNDPLTASLRSHLAGVASEARIFEVTSIGTGDEAAPMRDVAAFFGEPLTRSGLLIDAAAPSYERRVLGTLPSRRQPMRILGGVFCRYRRSLKTNAYFDERVDSASASHLGCTFCGVQLTGHAVHPYETPPLELTLRQIQAHQRDAPPEGLYRYELEDAWLMQNPEEFLGAVLERGVARSAFYVYLRVDEWLALHERLVPLLPELERAGHELRLLSMGIENLSPAENERFNKSVAPAQVWEAFETLTDLERRYPRTFFFHDEGGFSAILFTPWTTPTDLLVNLRAGRRLGVLWTSYAMGTRLQLVPGRAITALAEVDGLVTASFDDPAAVEPVCLTEPGADESAWRFRDPVVARAHRLLVRLYPIPHDVRLPPDDSLVDELNRSRSELPPGLDRDYVGLTVALVSALDALGPDAALSALFEHMASHAGEHVDADAPAVMGWVDAQLVARVVKEFAARNAERLHPVRLETARAVWRDTEWRVRLVVDADGESREWHVQLQRPDVPCWLSGEVFALLSRGTDARPSAAERRLGAGVLEVLDRHVAPRFAPDAAARAQDARAGA